MNLRTKSLLVLSLSSMLVAVVLYFCVQLLLDFTFSSTERIMEDQRTERVVQELAREAETLHDITAADWALWDDSYAFMQKPTQAFIDSNLEPEGLYSLRITVVGYLGLDLRPLAISWLDWRNTRPMAAPAWFDIPLARQMAREQQGLLKTPMGLMAFAMVPIQDSAARKPSNGYVLMGRVLDAQMVQEVGERNHLNVELLDLAGQEERVTELKAKLLLVELGQQTVTSWRLLRDHRANPIYLVKSDGPRDLYPVLQDTRRFLLVTVLVMVLCSTLFPLLLLNQTVISRIALLSEKVRLIRFTQNLKERLPEGLDDEVALLGQDINHMLDSLEASRKTLAAREQYFKVLSENSADAMLLLGADRRIKYMGVSITHLLPELDLEPGDVLPVRVISEDLDRLRAFWQEVSHNPYQERRVEVRHQKGTEKIWLEVFAKNLLQDPSVQGIVLHLRDISERKRQEERIHFMAYHDALTGLYNRHHLRAQGQQLVDALQQGAFFFMDLDHFKQVNDTLGHESGDQLLQLLVQRLQQHTPAGSHWFRLSGDEFGLLVPDLQAVQAGQLAQKLVQAARLPFQLKAGVAEVGVSIGIALIPQHGRNMQDLVRLADGAMYRAKTVRNAFELAH